MNTLEIVCESCESRMRLSEALLEKISGKTGRVTCKSCKNKVVLDARGDEVVVKEGGYAADEALELEQVSELPPAADVHLSTFPAERESNRPTGEVSLPPPLPEELKLRRSMRAAQQPNLEELAAAVNFAQDDKEFEAPEPAPMRAEEDSLSPHSIGDDDDESMVELGREFNSSPFASPRDESFNSLYPKRETVKEAPAPSAYVSKAPPAPKAGELSRKRSKDEIFEEAPISVRDASVLLGEDGQLLNKADQGEVTIKHAKEDEGKTNWVPWAVAAVALLAFGVSLSMKQETKIIVQAPAKSAPLQAAPAQAAAAPEKAEEETPSEAAVEKAAVEAAQDATDAEAKTANKPVASSTSVPKKAKPVTSEAQPKSEKAEEAAPVSAPASADKAPEEPEEEAEEPQPDRPPFSSAAASGAMRESTALASTCRRPGDPTGYATVVVTFAPSGRVTRASVNGPPYAGTQTGGCIASRFRSARVPAFSGEHVTVTKKIAIR